jgi:NAD-dependent dihydropyrimidine dehydrogenase PreA subunit
MIRKIIKIDKNKCNGCGLCAEACHEGAIGMVDGKAKLLRDDYCDGLGNCLPVCQAGAISFEEREAEAYDEAAVKANATSATNPAPSGGCPGSSVHAIAQTESTTDPAPSGGCPGSSAHAIAHASNTAASQEAAPATSRSRTSRLSQWPVQIKLIPVNAPYFEGAHLLISADCAAYAYGNFHDEFMRNKITLIGCPKLDAVDYAEKLTLLLKNNDIKSVTVVRMEVPCCGGIEHAVKTALMNSGKMIPWHAVTISTDGRILEE